MFVMACVMAGGIVACGEDEKAPETDGKIVVTPETLDFIAGGETKTVDVTGKNWTATPSADWIEVVASEGQITVTVGENELTEGREGSIEVKNAEDTKTIAVTQQAAVEPVDESLAVDPGELSFVAEGETLTVAVTSELEWGATTDDDWLTITEGDGSFEVTAAANELFEIRTASIVVSNGVESENKTITVSQEAAVDPYTDLRWAVQAFAMGDWNELGYEVVLQTAENITGDGYKIILRFFDGTPATEIIPISGTYNWKNGDLYVSYAIVEKYTGGVSGGEVQSSSCTMIFDKDGDTYTILIDGVLENSEEYHLRYVGAINFMAF